MISETVSTLLDELAQANYGLNDLKEYVVSAKHKVELCQNILENRERDVEVQESRVRELQEMLAEVLVEENR